MNQKDLLLVCLCEEASEVIQASAKIQRFGDRSPDYDNLAQLKVELNDFMAVILTLEEEGYFGTPILDEKLIEAKRKKIKHYLKVSALLRDSE